MQLRKGMTEKEYRRKYYQEHRQAIANTRRKYRQSHLIQIRAQQKKYDLAHAAQRSARAKQRRKDHPEKSKNWEYLRVYGISLTDYETMFSNQKGCCAICGRHQKDLKVTLCVDHNHQTKVVRGLLCLNCNRMLGLIHESRETLASAIIYLEGYEYVPRESA